MRMCSQSFIFVSNRSSSTRFNFSRRSASHYTFVLRGDGVNEMIPMECDFRGHKEDNERMTELYKKVVPYTFVNYI